MGNNGIPFRRWNLFWKKCSRIVDSANETRLGIVSEVSQWDDVPRISTQSLRLLFSIHRFHRVETRKNAVSPYTRSTLPRLFLSYFSLHPNRHRETVDGARFPAFSTVINDSRSSNRLSPSLYARARDIVTYAITLDL